MVKKAVQEEEIVAIWLKREFAGVWNSISHFLPKTPDFSNERIRAIVDNPNFKKEDENKLRLELLLPNRAPLLLPLVNARWRKKLLKENEFKELMVINEPAGWNILSDFTGKLSVVADRVFKEKGTWFLNQYVGGAVNGIYTILNGGMLDTNFILLESDDSEFTTILEGNKTAVALYLRCYYRKDLVYSPIKVFVGHLDAKCMWQW